MCDVRGIKELHSHYNTSRAWYSRMIMHKHAAVHAQTEYAKAYIGKIHVMSLHTMALHMYTYIHTLALYKQYMR